MDAILSWIGRFWTRSTTSPRSIHIVFGTAGLPCMSVDEVAQAYKMLQRHQVKDLDTAHIYVCLAVHKLPLRNFADMTGLETSSETLIGRTNGPKRFKIHTKAPGFGTGCLSKASVVGAMRESLRQLKVDGVRNKTQVSCWGWIDTHWNRRKRRRIYTHRIQTRPLKRHSRRFRASTPTGTSKRFAHLHLHIACPPLEHC